MKKTLSILLCVLFLSLSPAAARGAGIFASVDASTLGLGMNLGYQFSNIFKLRLNGNVMPHGGIFRMAGEWAAEEFGDKDQVAYTLNAHQYSWGLLADVHPFAGRFRVTAGAYYLKHDLSATITPITAIEIGDNSYDASKLGSLDVGIKWKKFAPYLGIGWGTEEGEHSAINFHSSLGVVFSKPTLRIDPNNVDPSIHAQLQKDIDEKKADIDDYLNYARFYPVISFGLSYRF